MRHPYTVGSGAVAGLGFACAVAVDRWGQATLDDFPITTNVIGTALGVALPAFFGAVFFERWKATETERRAEQWRQEQDLRRREEMESQANRLLVAQLADALIPRLDSLETRLSRNVLISKGDDYLQQLKAQLLALAESVTPGSAAIALGDERFPMEGLRILHGFGEALPRLREAAEALEQPLNAVGHLASAELREAVAEVRGLVEDFHNAVSSNLEDPSALLKRLTRARSGTWDGEMATLEDGQSMIRVEVGWLLELTVAAEELRRLALRLADATDGLRALADRELGLLGARASSARWSCDAEQSHR